jgi:hypothetical protein
MANEEVQKALDRATVPGYYGHIEIDIADGEIIVVRETRTTKLISRRGNSRNDTANRK